ncbi:hypothetical protein [Actinomyces wuliandei]|uniref:hypothetical protein n=1 Tax=Actinomyces wuliandei TaxID=2057743 RepID=UPI001117FE0D|nr:hypothetical protein [Actinomyces wuliandei]
MSGGEDFSPVLYDVMRELATQLGGRYVEWVREAESAGARDHWRAEQLRVMREVRAVDPDDRQAIEEHTMRLRAELALMPRYAPVLS